MPKHNQVALDMKGHIFRKGSSIVYVDKASLKFGRVIGVQAAVLEVEEEGGEFVFIHELGNVFIYFGGCIPSGEELDYAEVV